MTNNHNNFSSIGTNSREWKQCTRTVRTVIESEVMILERLIIASVTVGTLHQHPPISGDVVLQETNSRGRKLYRVIKSKHD